MPIFSYKCPSGHEHDELRKYEHKGDPSVCPSCGDSCSPQLSAPIGFSGIANCKPVPVSKANADVDTLRYLDGTCSSCGKTTTVFLDSGGAPEATACPECGSDSMSLSAPKPVPFSVTYPYYNRGLGMVITSPGHLRQVMRERGLVDADPKDLAAAAERHASWVADENAKTAAAIGKMADSNTYKSVVNSGWYTEHVNNAVADVMREHPGEKVTVESKPFGGSP